MYKDFFGLRENPFNVNPDPRYLFLTSQTRIALRELTHGIQSHRGLILLTGEVGTGKTTLINRLLEHLHRRNTPTAFIFNSHLETNHLFDFILADFGVAPSQIQKESPLMRLNQWLIDRYCAGGETPVLIVDEAQGLPLHVLEEIRLLLNLETPTQKLLQIVLAGQPELEERLRRPDLRQLKQRITLRCSTAALTLEESHEYVQARLRTAGYYGKPLFTPEAVDALHFYSRGVPRVLNLLCEHGLIHACADNTKPVPARSIRESARKFQFDDIKPIGGHAVLDDPLTNTLIAMQAATTDAPPQSPLDADPSDHADENIQAEQTAATRGVMTDLGEKTDIPSNAIFLQAQDFVEPAATGEDADSSTSVAISSGSIVAWIAKMAVDPATITPLPQLHVVESKPRIKTLSGVNSQTTSRQNRLELRAMPGRELPHASAAWEKVRASRTPPTQLTHKLRTELASLIESVTSTQINPNFRLCLKKSEQAARSTYRSWLVWLKRRPAAHLTRKQAGISAPVSQWLRQPWTLTLPSIRGLGVFAIRRKLTHKKV